MMVKTKMRFLLAICILLVYLGYIYETNYPKTIANRMLLQGVHQNRVRLVLIALEKGADPNLRDPSTGKVPKTKFAALKRLQTLFYGHPLYRDSWPVILEAAFKKEDAILKVLIQYGAHVNTMVDAITPLNETCFNGDILGTKLLLDAGANPNLNKNNPPLNDALEGMTLTPNLDEIMRYKVIYVALLDHGADPNRADKWGGRPIWLLLRHFNRYTMSYAIRHFNRYTMSYAKSLQLLLAHGANVNIRDADGDTPLLFELKYRADPHVVLVLLKAGADIYARDREGYNSIYWVEHLSETPAPEADKEEIRAIFHQWLRISRGGVKTPSDRNLQKTTGKEPYNKR